MTFVDDDQVEKIFGIFFVEPGAPLVFSEGLINREIKLAAFVDLAVLDLPAGVAEGRKHLIFGIVDQDITVGEKKNLRAAMLAGAVPTHVPELPTDLQSH